MRIFELIAAAASVKTGWHAGQSMQHQSSILPAREKSCAWPARKVAEGKQKSKPTPGDPLSAQLL
jgi:hypothetical protein